MSKKNPLLDSWVYTVEFDDMILWNNSENLFDEKIYDKVDYESQ